jgi:exopolyphosphatase/guanosine-5'-triphosphate,3'-diphosphate pyrophosphatase
VSLPARLSVVAEGSARRDCVAVVDVGSNSLRLVVYDGLKRTSRTLFNEKVMCGLGRGLSKTGRLDPAGVEQAKANIQRFVSLGRSLGASHFDILATAAVRDATDGPAFVAEIEKRFSVRVRVLSGEEEGKLSALGVLAAIPEASGLVGDLGGGSVELVELGKGNVGRAATLPLGPLRLADIAEDDKKLKDVVDRLLATVPWLVSPPEPVFYAVGGAWRALARIHMAETQYPLHVIQNYTLSRNETDKFLDFIAKQSRKSLDGIAGLSKKRIEVVPLAARILSRILKRMEPKRVVFSAWGLREGHLYSLLGPAERAADPLLSACAESARAWGRFPEMGEALNAWVSPLFSKEEPKSRRLRHAAALLSDIAWNEHPDYRAEQAVRHALYMPVAGIDHPGRAFVATALHARYGGRGTVELLAPLELLEDEELLAARAVGLALRLGYTLAAGVPAALSGTSLAINANDVTLVFSGDAAQRYGESVQRRLESLAKALGRRASIRRT